MQKEMMINIPDKLFLALCQLLLCLLLGLLIAGMGLGVLQVVADLAERARSFAGGHGFHGALKEVMIDVLMVLAVLELFRTVRAYFTEGRVKVTYIIDTVLVVVITEIMGFWYREVDPARVGLAIALVLALMFVRIMAIRFSPKRREMLDGL